MGMLNSSSWKEIWQVPFSRGWKSIQHSKPPVLGICETCMRVLECSVSTAPAGVARVMWVFFLEMLHRVVCYMKVLQIYT